MWAVINKRTHAEVRRFKYPIQCDNYITDKLNNSSVFEIIEVKQPKQTKLFNF